MSDSLSQLRCDPGAAWDGFLKAICPGTSELILCIPPTGGDPFGRRYTAEQGEEFKRNLPSHNDALDTYWSPNLPRVAMNKKPKKRDIGTIRFVFVDLDPDKSKPAAEEIERIKAETTDDALAAKGLPPPTSRVFSGGGYWLLWALAEPVIVPEWASPTDAPEIVRRVDGIGRRIASLFPHGDSCFNIDRIARLPFTVNRASLNPRKPGRADTLATVEFIDPARRYRLEHFPEPLYEAAPSTAPAKIAEEADAAPDTGVELADLPTEELRRVAEHGRDTDDVTRFRKRDGSLDRSKAVHWFLCECRRRNVAQAKALGFLTGAAFGISASIREKSDPINEARKQWRKAVAAVAKSGRASGGGRGNDDVSGRDVGRILLASRPRPIVHYQDEWLEYRAGCYRPVEDGAIRREVYETLEREGLPSGAAMVSNVVDALESLALVPKHEHTPPSWLDGREGPKPGELVAVANGLLHLPSGELLPLDSALFTLNALDYPFDPSAPTPERWLRFLDASYEPDCIPVIQEWFGNGLTDDTSQQKILTIIGPPRSGKGTTVRVFARVIGPANVCSPRLSALGENFGLAPLIGKRSAILSDMRMGKGTDVAAVAEAMLRVSGEDDVNIPRKHRDDWQGRLPTRFLILSNEPPSITDPSGALASRFIVLQMNTSFLGRENPHLTDELLSELPGILNWAIQGWRRLTAQRRYSVPASSAELVDHVRRVSSPMESFIADECEFAPDAMETKAALHEQYREWCIREGVVALSRELFAKQFIAATLGRAKPGKSRKAGEGRPEPVFFGVRLCGAPIADYGLYNGSAGKGGTPDAF